LQPSILQERKTIGSWGEQISDSDFPAEFAARILLIVDVYVCIRSGADGDDGDGDDGDGDDGDGDDGDGDDGDGDDGDGDDGDGDDRKGVSDGDHSTSST
jgi:hypothetical protein